MLTEARMIRCPNAGNKCNLDPQSQNSNENIWFKTKLSKHCREDLALRSLLHIVEL